MSELDVFTAPHSFETLFVQDESQYEVQVFTPDLRENQKSVWGDWGPMFTFELGESQGIRLAYSCLEKNLVLKAVVYPTCIELNSPACAADQRRWPLCLEFDDDARGLHFRAYLNKQGRVARTDVTQTHPHRRLDTLLIQASTEFRLSA